MEFIKLVRALKLDFYGYRRGAVLIVMGMLASSCTPPRKAAVEERATISQAQETERLGGAHIRVLQKGDSLWAIAFANSLDINKLAAWNELSVKAPLHAGQRLRLTAPPNFVYRSTEPATTIIPTDQSLETPAPPIHSQTTVVDTPAKSKVASELNSKPSSNPIANPTVSLSIWQWPSQGRVVERFALRSGQQGIDIDGSLGQPIVAARAGDVVYVGSGLKGYGNLVIIKHSNDLLSAYAQNLETFVDEGQSVAAGERIATMGQKRNRVALHFQVRLNGEPVNPLNYLPNR